MRVASVGFQCPDDVRLGRATQRAPRTVVGARIGASPPYVTWALVALNVAAYVATGAQSTRSINDPTASRLFQDWVLVPKAISLNGQYYRLLTSAFLHLNILHIVMNMFALIVVGPYLERMLGAWRFGAVYLLGALGGSVAVYAFGGSYTATAGASGAIFGLFAVALLLVRELGFDPQWLIGTIVINFVFTFSISGISKWGHVGGFLAGALAAVAIAGIPGRMRARVGRLSVRAQLAGLAALLVLLVVITAVRTSAL